MAKRKDPRTIRRLLDRRRREGLTWLELSEVSGVPLSTLFRWRRLLEDEKPRHASRRRFVELVAKPTASAAPPPPGAFEVVLRSGCRVVVPPGFDPEHLRRLIEVLGP